jgi:hypothetical protein
MRHLIIAAAGLVLLPVLACAQPTVVQPITPPPLTGYATLSVLAASLALSTATVGPNSPAFPVSGLPSRYLEVRNSVGSASTLYVCPLGGTCSSTVGVPLATGEVKTWMIPSIAGALVSPTVISGTTATALVAW